MDASSVSDFFRQAGSNLVHNTHDGLTSMTLKQWIRVVVIVGAYLLIRPYFIKHAAAAQARQLEAQEAAAAERRRRKKNPDLLSPNDLRGTMSIPEPSDDDEEDEEDEEDGGGGGGHGGAAKTAAKASGMEWGKRARNRQREVLKKLVAAEEERLLQAQGDQEDEDIAEFLHD